jgi:HlyD family secretion protein
MKRIKPPQLTLILLTVSTLQFTTSCDTDKKNFDASGSFEAVERIISAEAMGEITALNIEEGQTLQAATTIGQIDVSILEIQAEQVEASISAIKQKTGEAAPQVNVLKAQLVTQKEQVASLNQQLSVLNKEVNRFTKLVAAEAAPKKQLDDLVGQQSVLQKQLESTRSQSDVIQQQILAATRNVSLQNRAVLSEVEPAKKRLALIQKQIEDGVIINEYPGTVVTKYAYNGEFTSIGKPLYKIANLSTMTLRAYISGNQLPNVKLNQQVNVQTDDGNGGMRQTTGEVIWINSKAEFTPKTIQTKDERANQVYAVKINVLNPDGAYKIGMYGEVVFEKK